MLFLFRNWTYNTSRGRLFLQVQVLHTLIHLELASGLGIFVILLNLQTSSIKSSASSASPTFTPSVFDAVPWGPLQQILTYSLMKAFPQSGFIAWSPVPAPSLILVIVKVRSRASISWQHLRKVLVCALSSLSLVERCACAILLAIRWADQQLLMQLPQKQLKMHWLYTESTEPIAQWTLLTSYVYHHYVDLIAMP